MLPNFVKHSKELPSALRGLQDFIQVDLPIFIKWLPGGSAKIRPTGHRRGRPPRTDCEHSGQKVLMSIYDGRRRGRPPRPVLLLPWSHRPKGHRRERPPKNNPSLETDPVSIVFFIAFPDASCLLHVLLLSDSDVYPQSIAHSTSFQGGRRCRQRLFYPSAFFGRAFYFVHSSLSPCEKGCQTIKARGVD